MAYSVQQIMDALRSQESGGGSDPGQENGTGSGAFGPWQMMPQYWSGRAVAAGLPADAPKTLANQETVVRNMVSGWVTQGYTPQDIGSIWYSGHPLGADADAPQGIYPTIRQYSNSIMQKLGGGDMGSSSTSAATARSTSDSQDFLDFMAGIGMPKPDTTSLDDIAPTYYPSPGKDSTGKDIPGKLLTLGQTKQQQIDEANSQWNTEASKYFPSFMAGRTAAAKGILSPDQKQHQDLQDFIALQEAGIHAGTLDASQAASKLTAFIEQQRNALTLGGQQQTANAEMDKYGPGGNWSYNQLGGTSAQLAKTMGLDPNSSAMNFKTATPFDPAAAYTTNLGLMGGGAGPPGAGTPGAASQQIAALLAGNPPPGNDGGGVPSWGTTPPSAMPAGPQVPSGIGQDGPVPTITPAGSAGPAVGTVPSPTAGVPGWGTGPAGPYIGPQQMDSQGNLIPPPPPAAASSGSLTPQEIAAWHAAAGIR